MAKKDIITLSYINEHFEHLRKFILEISICISNIEQIIESDKDGLYIKPIESFIGHYAYLCYSTCAINSYKIFEKKECWSYIKLFNKIENFRFDKDLTNFISSNRNGLTRSKQDFLDLIITLREEISEKETLIKKVNNRRLKVYAHTDFNVDAFKPETIDDLKEIKDLAISIFHKIDGFLNDVEFKFNINPASIYPVLNDRKAAHEYNSQI